MLRIHRKHNGLSSAVYLRNFVFGIEDGLVSTCGFLSGIAVSSLSLTALIITGVVLIFVEAFSMAVGSFLSESSTVDLEKTRSKIDRPFRGSIIMFFSYLLSGFLVLSPYILFKNFALPTSIAIAFLALFLLGVYGAKLTGSSMWQRGIRMAILGGLAVLVGVFVSKIAELAI